jgi:hypothetical protein
LDKELSANFPEEEEALAIFKAVVAQILDTKCG